MADLWLAKHGETGADPTGVAESSTALNLWLASVSSGGGMIALPPGTFRCIAPLTWIGNSSHIVGSPYGGTTLLFDETAGSLGALIRMTNLRDCGLHNVLISSVSQRTANDAIFVSGGDSSATGIDVLKPARHRFYNVAMEKQFNGMHIQDAAGPIRNWIVDVQGGHWREFGNGGSPIWVDCGNLSGGSPGASHTFSNLFLSNSAGLASTSLAGIRISGGGDITFSDVKTWGFQHGFLCDAPAGRLVQAIQMVNMQFDTCSLEAFLVAPDATAVCTGWRLSNIWVANSSSDGIKLTGVAASINQMQFNNIGMKALPTAGKWGVIMDGCSDVQFSNLQMNDGASGIANGVRLSSSATNCAVVGARLKVTGARYQVDLGCTGYTLVGINGTGSGAGVDNGGAVSKAIDAASNI